MINLHAWIKMALTILIVAGFAVAIILLLHLTDLALSVLERLESAPPWLTYGYLGVLSALFGLGGIALYRVWRTPPASPVVAAGHVSLLPPGTPLPVPREEDVTQELEAARQAGADVASARQELENLAQRRAAGEVYVALFGEINSGKSALFQALLPEAQVDISPVGGATREVQRRVWQSQAGDRLVLADCPGFNEVGAALDAVARAEALRAHVVIYLLEGDLTRDQWEHLTELARHGKPIILALNKVDRLSTAERDLLIRRLRERLEPFPNGRYWPVVPIAAGGWREVTVLHPDGREQVERRPVPADVSGLERALQTLIDDDPRTLERLRDAAVFLLVRHQVDEARQRLRADLCRQAVEEYARRSVLGSLAAVAPGMDLVIQGALGVSLVNRLCDIHEVRPSRLRVDRLLKSANGRLRHATPLVLALAGNMLKAFPGLGTVAGGILHAVAYGIIFDALGRAVVETLETRGELAHGPAVRQFEKHLGRSGEEQIRHWIGAAMEEWRRRIQGPGAGR
ncbi:MAG: 50S ribosome-binding GTPase [Magnetococcus sp. WYHC-3]